MSIRRTLGFGWIGLLFSGVVLEAQWPSKPAGWVLIASGFIVAFWSEGKSCLQAEPSDIPLFILGLMIPLSVLASIWQETARIQAVEVTVGLVAFHGISKWVNGKSSRYHTAITMTLLLGAVLAAAAPVLVQWNRTKAIPIADAIYDRFPLLVQDSVHPNIMAALMATLFPLPFACLIGAPTRSTAVMRIFLAILCLLMGGILLLTKSRGGYLATTVAVLAVLWLSGKRKLAASLATVTVIVIFAVGLALRAGQVPFVSDTLDPTTWTFRKRVWQTALRIMQDFPLTGVGPGAFNEAADLLYAFVETKNPGTHNLYLQVGMDLGIPGLIAYLAILIQGFWIGITTIEHTKPGSLRTETIGLMGGLIALMVHGCIDVAAWNTRAAWIPWSMISLLIASHRMTTELGARASSTAPREARKATPKQGGLGFTCEDNPRRSLPESESAVHWRL